MQIIHVLKTWATPNGDKLIADMARVSNPANRNQPFEKLIQYMIRNEHWSPFEMANLCVQIECPRDIARQILRHRSFAFQEFSQRYADINALNRSGFRTARMQDTTNRQNSICTDDEAVIDWWDNAQASVSHTAFSAYEDALKRGIAKEVARSILPEGLTPSSLYMNGTVRSWIHYIKLRTHPSTQFEHREVAERVKEIFSREFPLVYKSIE